MYSISGDPADATDSVWDFTHTILIQGSMSLSKGGQSEERFQDLLDGIMVALRQNALLGGLLIVPMQPIEATPITHVMFGSVLVHRVIFVVAAKQRTDGSF